MSGFYENIGTLIFIVEDGIGDLLINYCRSASLPHRAGTGGPGYLHSIRIQFYRVLEAAKLVRHHGRTKAHGTYTRPTSYAATEPNRLWSWDITHLPSQVKGYRFYLYMVVDVFSRKVVGAEVHEKECGQNASELLQRSVWREKCNSRRLVLHADNGGPMKSFTM
ncbi:TPA: transposase family protein [Klebsiella michiganensis]|nr:transposase family protein [Klebsiella michiganensis]